MYPLVFREENQYKHSSDIMGLSTPVYKTIYSIE